MFFIKGNKRLCRIHYKRLCRIHYMWVLWCNILLAVITTTVFCDRVSVGTVQSLLRGQRSWQRWWRSGKWPSRNSSLCVCGLKPSLLSKMCCSNSGLTARVTKSPYQSDLDQNSREKKKNLFEWGYGPCMRLAAESQGHQKGWCYHGNSDPHKGCETVSCGLCDKFGALLSQQHLLHKNPVFLRSERQSKYQNLLSLPFLTHTHTHTHNHHMLPCQSDKTSLLTIVRILRSGQNWKLDPMHLWWRGHLQEKELWTRPLVVWSTCIQPCSV